MLQVFHCAGRPRCESRPAPDRMANSTAQPTRASIDCAVCQAASPCAALRRSPRRPASAYPYPASPARTIDGKSPRSDARRARRFCRTHPAAARWIFQHGLQPDRTQRNDHARANRFELPLEPRFTCRDLSLRRCLVHTALAARRPLEMLDGIRHAHFAPFNARFL
jgi:hypothetical protein